MGCTQHYHWEEPPLVGPIAAAAAVVVVAVAEVVVAEDRIELAASGVGWEPAAAEVAQGETTLSRWLVTWLVHFADRRASAASSPFSVVAAARSVCCVAWRAAAEPWPF